MFPAKFIDAWIYFHVCSVGIPWGKSCFSKGWRYNSCLPASSTEKGKERQRQGALQQLWALVLGPTRVLRGIHSVGALNATAVLPQDCSDALVLVARKGCAFWQLSSCLWCVLLPLSPTGFRLKGIKQWLLDCGCIGPSCHQKPPPCKPCYRILSPLGIHTWHSVGPHFHFGY